MAAAVKRKAPDDRPAPSSSGAGAGAGAGGSVRVVEGDASQMTVTPLGAGNEVGRSCHVLKFKGKTIMVRPTCHCPGSVQCATVWLVLLVQGHFAGDAPRC